MDLFHEINYNFAFFNIFKLKLRFHCENAVTTSYFYKKFAKSAEKYI